MKVNLSTPILASDITPESVFQERRAVLAALGLAGSAAVMPAQASTPSGAELKAARNATSTVPEAVTRWEDVTSYNNFYEFGTDKSDPAALQTDIPNHISSCSRSQPSRRTQQTQ